MKTFSFFLITLLLASETLSFRIKNQDTAFLKLQDGPAAPAASTPDPLNWYKVTDQVNPPSGRRGHSSIVSGDNLYIFGGCYLDQSCYNEFWEYNIPYETFSSFHILDLKLGLWFPDPALFLPPEKVTLLL